MSEVKQFVGIDISKSTFNVYGCEIGHKKFENNKKGFKQLLRLLEDGDCCVMESTGAYHQKLAYYLFEKGMMVAIVNPLSIKRYVQMKLKHTKTDKSDAKMISLYADHNSVDLWEAPDPYIDECRALHGMAALLSKQSAQLEQKKQYYQTIGKKKGKHMKALNAIQKRNQKEIALLEAEIESIIKANEPQLFSCLLTIPGIGKKTAIFLIVSTRGMSGFENAQQLISYFGMAPTERTSGTSLRGSTRISKAGDPRMRRLLFLCSFSAQRHNPQCKAMHARLVAKGKSEKLALIAVANKLLRQAFAIAQSRIPYDPEYTSSRSAA